MEYRLHESVVGILMVPDPGSPLLIAIRDARPANVLNLLRPKQYDRELILREHVSEM